MHALTLSGPIDSLLPRAQGPLSTNRERSRWTRFTARENIKHFVDRLQRETDRHTRWTLQKLLLEEEDKFAKLSERLDIMDQNILRIANLAVVQRARLNDVSGRR